MLKVKEIEEELKKLGFYETWRKYSKLIPKEGREIPVGKGKEHPVISTILKIREVLLDMGFTELILPIMIDVHEVYKQYGPEAPVILDRIYYLAGIPRPDIGLDKEKEEIIKKEIGNIDIKELKAVLRDYRKGKTSADELIEDMKRRLKVGDKEAIKLLEMFEPFFNLKPEPSSLTLRSHMTGAWFQAISEVLEYKDPPLFLFSIDWVFRREQREDESHLRNYHSASIVIVDENLSEEYAKKITKEIIGRLGFKDIEIKTRTDTARYYALNREWEVYANFKGRKYEIATGGFYNPISLAKYEIPYFVYNLGIGVERLAQIIYGEEDIRRLVYSHRFFKPSDEEIADMLRPIEEPKTEWGRALESILIKKIEENRDRIGPFKELVYEDPNVRIYLYEPDEGKKLVGPAAFNKIYVVNGEVISSVKDEEGVFVGRYIDFIVKRFVAQIERGEHGWIRARWAGGPSDINLFVPEKLLKWMMENKKRIDIVGPLFIDLIVERKSVSS